MSDPILQILEHIQTDIHSGIIVLPTLPASAQEIQQALKDENNCSVELLAELVGKDVTIASRLIQVANSPLYGAVKPITNIKATIQLLGHTAIYKLVLSIVIEQLFNSRVKHHAELLNKIATQSQNLASICRAMSLFTPHLDPNTAMLAGLIYQIGKLPLIKYCTEQVANDYPTEILVYVLDNVHGSLGLQLLNSWGFPTELATIPVNYQNFARTHDGLADYIDLVQISYFSTLGVATTLNDQMNSLNVNALAKCGLTADFSLEKNQELQAKIELIKSSMQTDYMD